MINSELEKIAYMYGDVSVRRKKQRRKHQKLLLLELVFDYAKNSTLHGFRYIVDQELNIVERLFWFLTVIVSLLLCSFYIYNVVHKWRTSPIIVTMNERLSPVGSVPFPSVTICPQMKVNAQIYNYTKKLKMLEENKSLRRGEEYTKFINVGIMCDRRILTRFFGDITNSSIVKLFSEVALTTDDIFYGCREHGSRIFCKKSFSKVITQDGVCYTTNSMAAEDIFEDTVQRNYSYMESSTRQSGWSLERGYNYSYNHFYPIRGRAFGTDPDLTFIMINDPDKGDKSCNKIFSGYKIYLHHPADLPQTSLYYYTVLPDQLSSMAISFHEFNSDKDLIAYDTEIRQCYFPSERKLYYFKTYTAMNCYAECLSNYTYRECNCVGFYMPHVNSSEICNPVSNKMNECMLRAKDKMSFEERQSSLGLNKNGCHCLPACNTVEYDAEVLKTDYQLQEIVNGLNNIERNPLNTYSRVELFYKKPQFITMQRRELFGFTDLLANIGGLLGVFLGFSFLSLIEIFYFSIVRVFSILKSDLEEEKVKEKSKVNDLKVKY